MQQPLSRLASRSGTGRRCPVCDGSVSRPRFRRALPWVVACTGCGLVRAEPQPSDAELESIYDEHYYEQFGFTAGPHANDGGLSRMKQATYARMLEVARPEVRSRTGRLLDVGCGVGFSLLAAAAAGFDPVGLDPLAPNDPAHYPGRRIVRGMLETFGDAHGFDIVSLIDVIEHVRDPVSTLAHAAELLAPGGVVLLATNDSSSLGARLLGSRWTHYHRAHLWFFTPQTLGRVAEQAGLELIRARPAARVYNLEYLASVIARGDNFPLAARLARLLLRVTPAAFLRGSWPPVREGFVLIARKAARAPGAP